MDFTVSITGFHQVVAKKAEQDMAALDTNYVEVTWHHGARPTHQVWQGKVYFWDRGFEDSLAELPETLDNSGESGIIDEKITYRMMNIYDEDALNPYTSEEIEKELQSSSIGRYVSHHIEYDGYSITMNYDENAPYNLCGRIHNKDIIIFPINNNDALEISETIIHEFAHEHFGWKYTQEHEVNCRIYEYLHSHNTISENQISQIVEFVKKEYSDFPEGDLYGY